MGKVFIILGIVFLFVGLLLHLFPKGRPAGCPYGRSGRLPRDIRIERENSAFYFPTTTMIIVSVILSLLSFCFVVDGERLSLKEKAHHNSAQEKLTLINLAPLDSPP